MPNFIIANPPHVPDDVPQDVVDVTLDEPNFRLGSRFCNFPTGKETLRSAYVQWVSEKLEPQLKAGQERSFQLRGFASRLGGAVANEQLSQRRLDAVQALIESRAAAKQTKVAFRRSQARGEDEAAAVGIREGDNSGFFRAVDVLFFVTREPPPIIKVPVLRRLGSQKFHIAFLSGISVAAGPFQADVLFFVIVDTSNINKKMAANYSYTGKGFTAPIPRLPPFSISDIGRFTPFQTTKPIFLPTFEGSAHVVQPPQITLGKTSVNSVLKVSLESLALREQKVKVIKNPIRVETGSGFGVTILSATEGLLKMVGAPFPFNGPIVVAG